MLRFKKHPDTIFLDLLDDALEHMIYGIDMEESSDQGQSFAVDMPRSSQFSTAQKAKEQLRALQRAFTLQNCTNRLITTGCYCISVYICIAVSSMISRWV